MSKQALCVASWLSCGAPVTKSGRGCCQKKPPRLPCLWAARMQQDVGAAPLTSRISEAAAQLMAVCTTWLPCVCDSMLWRLRQSARNSSPADAMRGEEGGHAMSCNACNVPLMQCMAYSMCNSLAWYGAARPGGGEGGGGIGALTEWVQSPVRPLEGLHQRRLVVAVQRVPQARAALQHPLQSSGGPGSAPPPPRSWLEAGPTAGPRVGSDA